MAALRRPILASPALRSTISVLFARRMSTPTPQYPPLMPAKSRASGRAMGAVFLASSAGVMAGLYLAVSHPDYPVTVSAPSLDHPPFFPVLDGHRLTKGFRAQTLCSSDALRDDYRHGSILGTGSWTRSSGLPRTAPSSCEKCWTSPARSGLIVPHLARVGGSLWMRSFALLGRRAFPLLIISVFKLLREAKNRPLAVP